MVTNRLLALLATATVVLVFAQAASAKDKIVVDPGSPAGKQYAIPLDDARGAAGGGSTGSSSPSRGNGQPGGGAPGPPGLFGRGVSSPVRGSQGSGSTTNGRSKRRDDSDQASTGGGGSSGGGSNGPGGGAGGARPRPQSSGELSRSSTGVDKSLFTVGGALLVVVVGGGAALAIRLAARRRGAAS